MTTPDITSATATPVSPDRKKIYDKINKTAEEFEAVFITQMMKPMFDMVKVNSEFGGGKGEEVFRDFTIEEYGKRLSSKGGIGIANHVREQLIYAQAAQEHPGASPERLAVAIKELTTEAKRAGALN